MRERKIRLPKTTCDECAKMGSLRRWTRRVWDGTRNAYLCDQHADAQATYPEGNEQR